MKQSEIKKALHYDLKKETRSEKADESHAVTYGAWYLLCSPYVNFPWMKHLPTEIK